jgi:hypothetical protein
VISWLVVVAVVLGVNLLPALGPPTWLVLVLLRLHLEVDLVPLVVLGALSATAGRLLLAQGTRAVARWLPAERVARLEAAGALVQQHRGRAAAGLGLFLLSPLPSAQLFEAAGLMRLALRPLAIAFLLGRLASYSVYAGAATAVDRSYGDAFRDSLTSWPSLVLQGGLLVLLWQLGRVDWVTRLARTGTKVPATGAHTAPANDDADDDRGGQEV